MNRLAEAMQSLKESADMACAGMTPAEIEKRDRKLRRAFAGIKKVQLEIARNLNGGKLPRRRKVKPKQAG